MTLEELNKIELHVQMRVEIKNSGIYSLKSIEFENGEVFILCGSFYGPVRFPLDSVSDIFL